MNKDKIIEKLKDLIVYLNAVIISGHREPEIENKLLDEIAVLESEQTEEGDSLQSSEPEKHKTAEEIKHKINQIICRYFQDGTYKTNTATEDLYNLLNKSTSQPEKVTDEQIELAALLAM